LTNPLAEVTTTVSRLALEEAVRRHGVPRQDVLLVPNGIRTERYRPDPVLRDTTRSSLGLGGAFTWLSAGRLERAKRHSDLLAAVAVIRASQPDVRVLIAGKGSLHDALQAEIETLGLTQNVSLLGLRTDVRALMQAADGFVMSSAWEGLPIVLLEASASGLPIVATDVGGSHDVISEGESGFIVPPRQPRQVADAMLRMMALAPTQRRAMGERGREQSVSDFDVERVADRWEELYQARHSDVAERSAS
jgi:glycosyltransferase involved in cell wall biosynthesis